jgi:hypothetical protein
VARSQIVTFDMLLLALGASVLMVSLYLSVPPVDTSFHERIYSEWMVLNALNRSAPLLAKYLCSPDQNLHDILVQKLTSSLDSMNRDGYSYILAANDIRVYSDVADVCLGRVGVVRINLTTLCGDAEVIFGMWPRGEEVSC